VSRAESKTWFRDKRRKEAIAKACEALMANLSATIGTRAFDFGRALLDRVLEELKTIAKSLADWAIAIEKLRHELDEEISRRKSHMSEKMASLKDFNGAILFHEERINTLYQSFDITAAIRHVESRLFAQADGGCLAVPFLGRHAADRLGEEPPRAVLNSSITASPQRSCSPCESSIRSSALSVHGRSSPSRHTQSVLNLSQSRARLSPSRIAESAGIGSSQNGRPFRV
jgi:hypothetical protein